MWEEDEFEDDEEEWDAGLSEEERVTNPTYAAGCTADDGDGSGEDAENGSGDSGDSDDSGNLSPDAGEYDESEDENPAPSPRSFANLPEVKAPGLRRLRAKINLSAPKVEDVCVETQDIDYGSEDELDYDDEEDAETGEEDADYGPETDAEEDAGYTPVCAPRTAPQGSGGKTPSARPDRPPRARTAPPPPRSRDSVVLKELEDQALAEEEQALAETEEYGVYGEDAPEPESETEDLYDNVGLGGLANAFVRLVTRGIKGRNI